MQDSKEVFHGGLKVDEEGRANDPAQLRVLLHSFAEKYAEIANNHPELKIVLSETEYAELAAFAFTVHAITCPHATLEERLADRDSFNAGVLEAERQEREAQLWQRQQRGSSNPFLN